MDPFASRSDLFYRHSWKAPIGGVLLVGLVGLLSTLILGVIYGYAMFFIPFIYIRIIVMIGYPFVVAFLVSWAVRTGKVRNFLLVILAGVGFGILADYAGWVAWMSASLGNPAYLVEFFFPGDILLFMRAAAEYGIYNFNGSQPTGAIVYLVWLGEAAVVIGIIAYMVIKNHLEATFCEECHAWVDGERYLGLYEPIANPSRFKREIQQGNFFVFEELKPSNNGNQFTKMVMQECGACHNFRVLNVKTLKLWVNSKNKLESREKTLLSNLRVNSSLWYILQKLVEKQNQIQSPTA